MGRNRQAFSAGSLGQQNISVFDRSSKVAKKEKKRGSYASAREARRLFQRSRRNVQEDVRGLHKVKRRLFKTRARKSLRQTHRQTPTDKHSQINVQENNSRKYSSQTFKHFRIKSLQIIKENIQEYSREKMRTFKKYLRISRKKFGSKLFKK